MMLSEYFKGEERYKLLQECKQRGLLLTEEEDQFIQDFALQKLTRLLEDPELMSVLNRLRNK
jgi:hypothetical protein